jgi:hypothetical protein
MNNEAELAFIKVSRRIADNMAMVGGPDLRNLNDEALCATFKSVIITLGDAMCKTGASSNEAEKAISNLSKQISQPTSKPTKPGLNSGNTLSAKAK